MSALIFPLEQPDPARYTYPGDYAAALSARPDPRGRDGWVPKPRRLAPQLACLADPAKMERCRRDRLARPHTGRCVSANHPDCAQCQGADRRSKFYACPQGCDTNSYLFPRKIRYTSKFSAPVYGETHEDYIHDGIPLTEGPKDVAWHYHQGLDMRGQEAWDRIVSVSAGRVIRTVTAPDRQMHTPEGSQGSIFGGYGKIVLVDPGTGLFYFYAHCDEVLVEVGQEVQVGSPLAMVGKTLFDHNRPNSQTGPHLHFEVRTRVRPDARIGFYGESTPDYPPEGEGNRIDARAHLEGIGTARPTVYFPVTSANVAAPAPEVDERGEELPQPAHPEWMVHDPLTADLFAQADREGGRYPVGANNFWHGGVHVTPGEVVRAPFDATVVAARLDPSLETAVRPDGSVNFILLAHRVPPTLVQALAHTGGAAESSDPWAGHRVGSPLRSRGDHNTPPEFVVRVRELLHDVRVAAPEGGGSVRLYDPAAEVLRRGTVDERDEALEAAIRTLQSNKGMRRPDGRIDYGRGTWGYLLQQAAAGRGDPPPPPPPDTVYTLLMHLPPRSIDAELVERVPWLGRVELEPSAAERRAEAAAEREAERQVERDRAGDPADRDYVVGEDVGHHQSSHLYPNNYTADVRWVQERLTVHGQEIEANGRAAQALQDKIKAFQRHVQRVGRRRWAAGGRPARLRPSLRSDGLVSVPGEFPARPARGTTTPGTFYALGLTPEALEAWFDYGEAGAPAPTPAPATAPTARITGSVGFHRAGAPNETADVRWVQRRLNVHRALWGADSTALAEEGHFDAATEEAILAFQRARGKTPDGLVSAPSARARASLPAPDQDTSDALFNQLRKTEAELGGAAGAASWMRLARRVAELRSESPRVGRVVLCGGTPVSAGEALWVVPQPPEVGEDSTDEERSAASALVPQDLHWEMFSCDELPLVARWDKLPDPNDAEADRDLERDMSIEIPSLIRQIEAGTEVGEDDQRLTIEELNDFYASEGSHALRQTQYRFCSEWGLDLELARARAAELGFRRSPAFWRLIAAYQWWEEAAAAEGFPASPVVWHYHPVAFMELYQSLLRGEA